MYLLENIPTVIKVHVPNNRYGPQLDLARNNGVVKAMIQFTT